MVVSKTFILQYGPPDSLSTTEIQRVFQISSNSLSIQEEFNISGQVLQTHIYPAQNPMPRQYGPATPDEESFSDSPTNAPTMSDLQRYSYGRLGSVRYGTLQFDNGAFVAQKAFINVDTVNTVQFLESSNTATQQAAFQPAVPVLVQQDVFTSSFIEVEQFAFLLTALPVPFSIKNPVDSDVYIRLSNHSIYPLASGTISLWLDGVRKEPLEVVPFHTGIGGIDVTWSNAQEFSYGELVDVRWLIYDTAFPSNKIVIEYWFKTVEDKTGPRISNRIPSDNTTGVSITSGIIFDITDAETGVDITTLELFVNNKSIDLQSDSITIVSIVDGYRVQYITPEPYLYGDIIPVVVKVSDLVENRNTSFFIWSFKTEGSSAPVLFNMDPVPCSTGVHRIKTVSFEVVDGGHGLNKDSILMGIEGERIEDVLLVPIIRRLS